MVYDKNFHPDNFILLSEEGLSNNQIAARWGINVKTIQRWAADDNKPEFQQAYEIGQQREEAVWEQLGYDIASGKCKGNGIVYIYSMKARFGGKWLNDGKHNTLSITTKQENMSDKELNAHIKRLLDKEIVINAEPLKTTIPELIPLEYGLQDITND